MTWTPSEGLKRADAVVAQIEQAIGACENALAGSGILRHRLTEIVAKAIDDAIAPMREALDKLMLDKFPDFVSEKIASNGHAKVDLRSLPGAPAPLEDKVHVVPHASFTDKQIRELGPLPYKEEGAPKRRGRPKGSTKKKAKASKPDKAVETAQAE